MRAAHRTGGDTVSVLCVGQLLEGSADGSATRRRRRRQAQGQEPGGGPSRPYVAAKLETLPEVFTLGDESKYNGFHNKALPGQQQYLCFVLAALKDHDSVSDSPPPPPLNQYTPPPPYT